MYGTLRAGGANDITRLQPPPRFVGRASILGVLHSLGAYPGVVLGGDRPVWGEIYEITSDLERQLDVIEGVWPQQTGEYVKREMEVHPMRQAGDVLPAAALNCIVYEINPAHVAACPIIESGDWMHKPA